MYVQWMVWDTTQSKGYLRKNKAKCALPLLIMTLTMSLQADLKH